MIFLKGKECLPNRFGYRRDVRAVCLNKMLDLIYYLKNAIKQRDQEEEAKNKELLRMIQESKTKEQVSPPSEITVSEDAKKEANDIKKAALRYADELLASVQGSIEKTLSIIVSNRDELNQ